ncbi:hypothetical protein HYDPIDRAFT_167063 [Hydnomerulius pinastri MD-312]|nr:hypothetical protein HYDPIDRAFT_167063 [Hydnomerulius pinastri MD-312]
MHSTNDQSIFAWRYPLSHGSFGYGPLAVSVDLFAGSRDIHCIPPDIWIKYCNNIIPGVVLRLDFATTNDGLHINLPLQPLGDDRFLALLSCSHRPTYSVVAEAGHILHVEPYSVVGIHLRQSIRGIEHYERVDGHVLDDIYTSQLTAAGSSGFVLRDVHIGDSLRALGMVSESHIAPSIAQFLVQIAGVRESGYDVAEVDAVEKCTVEKREDGNLGLRIRRSFQGRSRIATIKFENPDTKKVFEVILGMSWDWGEGEGPLVYLSPQRSEASQDPIGNRDLRMDWATMRLGTDELVSVGVKKGGALIFGGSRSLVTENHLVTVQVRKVGAQSMGR